MKWSKPIINYRNKLSTMVADTDRCDLIEISKLTQEERNYIREHLSNVLSFIDTKLNLLRPK